MIFRRQSKVNDTCDEIGFMVSLTTADVKKWLTEYVSVLSRCGIEDFAETEQNIRHWLEHEIFVNFPLKHSGQLSKWVVATGLRKKYLSESATTQGRLIFAESIVKKAMSKASE